MAYELVWEPKGLYRRFYGCTSDLEVVETSGILQGSPQFEDIRYTILDFLGVTDLTISTCSFIEEIAAIGAVASRRNTRIKVAVVTTSEQIVRFTRIQI